MAGVFCFRGALSTPFHPGSCRTSRPSRLAPWLPARLRGSRRRSGRCQKRSCRRTRWCHLVAQGLRMMRRSWSCDASSTRTAVVPDAPLLPPMVRLRPVPLVAHCAPASVPAASLPCSCHAPRCLDGTGYRLGHPTQLWSRTGLGCIRIADVLPRPCDTSPMTRENIDRRFARNGAHARGTPLREGVVHPPSAVLRRLMRRDGSWEAVRMRYWTPGGRQTDD